MRKKIILVSLLVITSILGVILDFAPISVPGGIDKIYHFIGFAVFSTLLVLCYVEFYGTKAINKFIVVMLILGGFAACGSEMLQSVFDDNRDCSAADWFFDVLAIGTVGTVSFFNYTRKEETINNISFTESEEKAQG